MASRLSRSFPKLSERFGRWVDSFLEIPRYPAAMPQLALRDPLRRNPVNPILMQVKHTFFTRVAAALWSLPPSASAQL